MKVFFISTPKGESNLGDQFRKIYDEIERLGYEHISDYIKEESSEDFATKMIKGKDASKDFYAHMIQSLQSADICIFEATTPSSGVGYLIEKSLSLAKPTIVLYYKESAPFLLSGIDDEKLIVRNYTEKNFKKVLSEVLTVARERRDKRFNFFISPKLLEYLENASKEEGITKSKFIRNLIVDHMRKNNNDPS